MSFTWKPIYKELAKNILEYEDRQSELLQLLRDLESEDLPVVITDKDAPNKTIQLMEIDPLTFFAAFNRSLTDENRIAILKHCRKVFGLAAEVPEDFVGLPLVNNQNTWYFGYHYVRDLEDIPTLWQLARFAVDAPDSSEMGLFFDKALGIHGIKMGKLTSGLFWLNPEVFLPAESNSRNYFEGSFGIELPEANWESYCRYRNAVREKAGTDFAALSDTAYVYAGDSLRV